MSQRGGKAYNRSLRSLRSFPRSGDRRGAVKAGVELDLFTAIGEGATTTRALAMRCQAAERGVSILCDSLTVIGLLEKEEAHLVTAISCPRDSSANPDRWLKNELTSRARANGYWTRGGPSTPRRDLP